MGLKADVTGSIKSALDGSLSDAKQSLELYSVSTSTYDANGGVVTANTVNITIAYGVVMPVNASMIDGESIRVGDVTFLFFDEDVSVAPKVGDHIMLNSVKYDINNVVTDPATVAYECYARAA